MYIFYFAAVFIAYNLVGFSVSLSADFTKAFD